MPKIVLDFDHTLFNAQAFKLDLAKALGLSQARWDRQYKANKKKYKYYYHLNHIESFSQDKQDRFLKVLNNAQKYLYPDAIGFLKQIKKYKPVLLTFGFPKWQKLKVRNSGVDKYLTVKTTSQNKVNYFKNKKNIIIINDRGSEIDSLKKKHPQVMAIWIRRRNGKYKDEPCKLFDYKITNLKINLKDYV